MTRLHDVHTCAHIRRSTGLHPWMEKGEVGVSKKVFTNYQLPNGLIKVRRRWGQRHPQGANSGSNGKLKLMLNSKQLPPAHPYPMLANVYFTKQMMSCFRVWVPFVLGPIRLVCFIRCSKLYNSPLGLPHKNYSVCQCSMYLG
jgi:hypothetical protein